MLDLIKKQWITFLGTIFMFLAFSYLFKLAVDMGIISDSLKIAIGIVFGTGFAIAGFMLHQRQKQTSGQIITGLGVALLYTTFSFAGIYFNLWLPITVFIAMVAVTAGACVYSYMFDLRILMNTVLLGALISPLVMKPHGDQVFTLFLYLLVINTAFFFTSVSKKWTELRLTSFIGTWILFTVYYFYFNPSVRDVPLRYAICAFIFYVLGFAISSWKQQQKFDGLNLYLGIVNAVLFTLWSCELLNYDVNAFSVVLALMGIIYLASAFIFYSFLKKYSSPVIINFFGGLMLIAMAGSELGSGTDVKPIFTTYIWAVVTIVILLAGQLKKLTSMKIVSSVIWLLTCSFWFVITWQTPVGFWFGRFIPVFNWSGMAWVLLSFIGFYFSLKVRFENPKIGLYKSQGKYYASFFAVISHLMVGGLFTFQITRLWYEYKITTLDLGLTISVSWSLYALTLFMWGAYSRQSIFRWFGSIMLIIVALKTIFNDLYNSETIYKVLVLFILGAITFLISFINNKWKQDNEKVIEVKKELSVTENHFEENYGHFEER